jgi:hypothetical protein
MDACASVISFSSFSFFKKKQEDHDLSGHRGQSLLLRIAGRSHHPIWQCLHSQILTLTSESQSYLQDTCSGPLPVILQQTGHLIIAIRLIRSGLGKNLIIFCKRKADCSFDLSTMFGNLFEAVVDRRIKILLATVAAYPGGYAIHINRLTLEMKPGLDDTFLHYSLTEFADIVGLFSHT